MKRYITPALFILLGLLFLIFSQAEFWDFEKTIDPIAKILNSTNNSAKFRPSTSIELKSVKKTLGHRDILLTNNSVVSLEILNSGVTLDILRNSIVIFKKISSDVVLTFLEGNFRVVSSDSPNKYTVNSVGLTDILTLTVKIDKIHRQIYEPSDIRGSNEREDPYITSVMDKHLDLFERCYHRLLKKDPMHEGGYISMAFVINTSGYVSYIKLADSSIQDTELQKCVERVIKTIKFRGLKSETFITYPIQFQAK